MPEKNSVEIKRVTTRADLRRFVAFPNHLYKGNAYYVPKLRLDEMSTLGPKNPALDFCKSALFLAWSGGKVVGRVAAIINTLANERWNHAEVRFGWFDFIDDLAVSKALLDAVTDFGRQHGMTQLSGPLGFTDFDPEGMLVEGFDKLCTMALIYNHPYYMKHMEALGLGKEVDWLEYNIFIPEALPEKITRVAQVARERYGIRVRKISRREIKREKLGQKIFALVNETYKDLYNFTILPDKMIDHYVSFYLGVLDLDFVTLLEDAKGEIVGLGVTMPGITRALQKCGGRLFPFGWYHVVKALYFKHEPNVELLLIGVKDEYKSKGLISLIFEDLIPRYRKAGFIYGETNAELESNRSVQAPWEMFDYRKVKRRRIYTKQI